MKFTNSNSDLPEATRVHLEPTISLPLGNRWGSLTTEAKLLATHYNQTNIDDYNNDSNNANKLASSVNRTMPQLKVDGKMVFERDVELTPGYTQTLEPDHDRGHITYL